MSMVDRVRRKMKGWMFRLPGMLSCQEVEAFLAGFRSREIHCTGFASAFVPEPKLLNRAAAGLDGTVFNRLPRSWKYVAFGHAVK